jgi:hypothetical protein
MPNWNEILKEVQTQIQNGNKLIHSAFDRTRRKYLKRLKAYTGRNVIAYYSGFLSKPPVFGLEINDEDKNGFMMAIHQMDRTAGLDLLLHTPGGSIAAAESLVSYLNQMFGTDIRAIVPQIAMSAGTMIACSCKSIVMSKHSNLGPIDPQINGVPAQGVLDEVEKAYKEISSDPSRLQVWQFILGKYTPTYIGQCEQAVAWSKDFVRRQLLENMLASSPNKTQDAEKIITKLSNYAENKAHNRHFHMDECISIGLSIERLECDQKLQDLVLPVHHCFMHTLANTNAIKIIENDRGVAYIKQMIAS